MKTYETDDFFKALKSDEGLPPLSTPEAFTGMVDPEKSSEEELSFAPGTQCSYWTRKKKDEIERVDHLGSQRCGQDEYPYVRLHGEFTDEERVVFRALQAETRPAPGPPPAAGPSPAPPPADKPTPAPPPAARIFTASDGRTYYEAPTPRGMPGPDKGC
jgi:hypothetical protein